MKKNVSKIFALILTLGVLITFILSAPAQAYILRLDASDKHVNKGDKVSFLVSVQKENNDRANITSIQFKLSGPLDIVCNFKENGEILNGCDGITIEKIDTCSDYGYGYGEYRYGYDSCNYGYYSNEKLLKYNITYNTGAYFAGSYKTSIAVMSGNNVLDLKSGESLNVTFPNYIVSKRYCSIRAKNGLASADKAEFGKSNKINFYISQTRARPGEGYITGQKGRTTFSYKFSINDVIERDANHTAVAVSGKYKVGLGKQSTEKSVIYLNKKTGSLNVVGDNIEINYMDVNFNQGNC